MKLLKKCLLNLDHKMCLIEACFAECKPDWCSYTLINIVYAIRILLGLYRGITIVIPSLMHSLYKFMKKLHQINWEVGFFVWGVGRCDCQFDNWPSRAAGPFCLNPNAVPDPGLSKANFSDPNLTFASLISGTLCLPE